MGAEESVLKAVEVGEPFPQNLSLTKIWTTVAPARRFECEKATVFLKEFGDEDDQTETKKFLECGIQTLKSLRHPRILKYLDGSINKSNACLIVERVRPLDYCLAEGFEKDEILSGLCDVFDAVAFLHEKAGLSHNNIGPVSVFITSDGAWRLGSFECAQRLENCLHWCQTDFAKRAKDDSFIPPEDQQMMYSNVPVYARDIYGLGKLVEYLMATLQDMLTEEQKIEVTQLVDGFTSAEAAKRPSLRETNWKRVFRNDLYEIGDFLRELPLKTPDEKSSFFCDLVTKLERLPQVVVARRLSRLLLSRFVLLEPEAVEHFLPRFVTFQDDDTGLLSSHLFKQFIVPELRKVFCVRETAIRLALLRHFNRYCDAFDEAALRQLILPELLLGMKDSDETIVAASMRCLADLVPLLGAEAVTGLKHMKYFSEGRPRMPSPLDVPDLSKLTSVKDAFTSDSKHPTPLQSSISKSQVREHHVKPLVMKKSQSTVCPDSQHENASKLLESPSLPIVPLPAGVESDEKPDLDWVDWETDDLAASAKCPAVEIPVSPSILFVPTAPATAKRTSQPEEKQSTRPTNKPLGAEFDVREIQISTKSLEDDLFADLAPRITTVSSFNVTNIGTETAPTSSTSKFEAAAVDEVQDVGWDDAQLDS